MICFLGICKIKSPRSFNPPFAIDRNAFRFKTRIQDLAEIDGVARVERRFMRKWLRKRTTCRSVTCSFLCRASEAVPCVEWNADGKQSGASVPSDQRSVQDP